MLDSVAAPGPACAATWAIESPTPGVVIISVEIEGSRSLSPLHWRAGDWTKPPLDIELNPDHGAVQAVQIVLQDENVPRRATIASQDCVVGVPVVDVAGWPTDRYRDVRRSMQVARASTGELVIKLGALSVACRAGLPGSLMFGWDESSNLCEVVIGPLTSEGWDDIDALSGQVGGA